MTDARLDIRPFRESDAAAVKELWRRAFPNDPPRNDPEAILARKRRVQPELLLVGEVAGDLVATVVGGYDGYRGWAYHLAVSSEHRRCGHGRAMMRRLEELLVERGCPKLNLQVRQTNREVVAFYESLGYPVENHVSMGKVLR